MQGAQLAQDLLNIEVVATLNQGFCHLHHLKFCPRTEQLLAECAKVNFTLRSCTHGHDQGCLAHCQDKVPGLRRLIGSWRSWT